MFNIVRNDASSFASKSFFSVQKLQRLCGVIFLAIFLKKKNAFDNDIGTSVSANQDLKTEAST